MTSRSLLTVTAVVAVLYGLAFLLIPDGINALYGVPSAPHTALYTRFFGSALLGFGVIDWFAKDFRSLRRHPRVLIGSSGSSRGREKSQLLWRPPAGSR